MMALDFLMQCGGKLELSSLVPRVYTSPHFLLSFEELLALQSCVQEQTDSSSERWRETT